MEPLHDPIFDRPLKRRIEAALADTPVVALLGPRQVGKSTLAKTMFPDRPYFDLDDPALGNAAASDPAGFLEALPSPVTLDEVQKAPALLAAVKLAVDRHRQPGRFLLTGSANLLLLPQLGESLAGRMEVLHLSPLTEAEKERSARCFLEVFLNGGLQPAINPEEPVTRDIERRLLTGGYPEAVARPPRRARNWHRQYLNAVIERDVKDVARVRDAREVARLLELLAHRMGSPVNVSNLADTLGITRPTVEHYMAVLERLFLIRLLPAWSGSADKRAARSPKIHLTDTGLAATLMDIGEGEWNTRREDFGLLLECMVIQQLVAQSGWVDDPPRLWHFRDKDQTEVDCVLTRGRRVWGVEIKSARAVSDRDAKGLARLSQRAGTHFAGGIVIHPGNSVLPLCGGKFLAVPASELWRC